MKKLKFRNKIYAMDIETTRCYHPTTGDPIAFTYSICFKEEDKPALIFRNWEDYHDHIRRITQGFSKNEYIVIYVHNLAYEFSFMRGLIKCIDFISNDLRHPIAFRCKELHIQYRDSYQLERKKLEKIGDELGLPKLDLDYTKQRNDKTELSAAERLYIIRDVEILEALIKKYRANYGTITEMPYTETGVVRKVFKNILVHNNEYMRKIRALKMTPYVAEVAISAFQGGYTHANPRVVGKVLHDIICFDFASSYPSVMLIEPNFPMTKGYRVAIKDEKDYEELLKKKKVNIISTIKIENYKTSSPFPPISESKISNNTEVIFSDNGRVVRCQSFEITVTEYDLKLIKRSCPTCKVTFIKSFMFYKGFLPKEFRDIVATLYGDKTKLKGTGEQEKYNHSKRCINSTYGMCVTSPLRDRIVQDFATGDLIGLRRDFVECIEEVNGDPQRFNYYLWGVYITAIARFNLLSLIYDIIDTNGPDSVYYCDTDSIYVPNKKSIIKIVDKYNKNIDKKYKKSGFSYDELAPISAKGERKPIGHMVLDGAYDSFKVLGAKRYITEKKGKLSITVAGLNGNATQPDGGTLNDYITKKGMNFFSDNMYISKERTGKLGVKYSKNKEPITINHTDYQGHESKITIASYCTLEEVDFTMSLSDRYKEFLDVLTI